MMYTVGTKLHIQLTSQIKVKLVSQNRKDFVNNLWKMKKTLETSKACLISTYKHSFMDVNAATQFQRQRRRQKWDQKLPQVKVSFISQPGQSKASENSQSHTPRQPYGEGDLEFLNQNSVHELCKTVWNFEIPLPTGTTWLKNKQVLQATIFFRQAFLIFFTVTKHPLMMPIWLPCHLLSSW